MRPNATTPQPWKNHPSQKDGKPSPTSVMIEISTNNSNDTADLESLSSRTSQQSHEETDDHAIGSLGILPLPVATTRQPSSSTLNIGVGNCIQSSSIERFQASRERIQISAFDVDENDATTPIPIRRLKIEEDSRVETNEDNKNRITKYYNDHHRVEDREGSIVVLVNEDDVKVESVPPAISRFDPDHDEIERSNIAQQPKNEPSPKMGRPQSSNQKAFLLSQADDGSSHSSSFFDSSDDDDDDDDDLLLVGSLQNVIKDIRSSASSLSTPKEIPVKLLIQHQWYLLITILAYARQEPRDDDNIVSVADVEQIIMANNNHKEMCSLSDSKRYPIK
mmetsp:Transcript_16808/g.24870  ORF Transcript_16808/g.24870 Transcript_16808/m.24870 type:complete len:335 (-) Transcript_16808:2310-3314(-)